MKTLFGRRLAGATALSVAILSVATVTGATTLAPTLAQIKSDVAASVLLTNVNGATSLPPLTSMTRLDTQIVIDQSCYNTVFSFAVPSNASTLCAFGQLNAARTILLTGDSQAAMWSPTLKAFGAANGWKIVMLAKSGCGPWGNPNPLSFVIFETMTVAECNTWNQNVASWAGAHHPKVVVMVGRGYPLGADHDKAPVLLTLESEIAATATRFTASHARLIVLSPIPRFTPYDSTYVPSDCASIPNSLQKCQLSFLKIVPQVEFQADSHEAKIGKIKLALVTPLFCTGTAATDRCTVIMKDGANVHLMYFDGSHINRFFATWVLPAFVSILHPLLPR